MKMLVVKKYYFSNASAKVFNELIKHTDRVAEMQNTLRKRLNVILTN